MTKNKKQQDNKALSLLQQRRELFRKLKESEFKCQKLQEDNEKLRKELSGFEINLKAMDKERLKLCTANDRIKEKLSIMGHKNAIEKFLKNEAYAFLLSEGYEYNYKVNLWQRKRQG